MSNWKQSKNMALNFRTTSLCPNSHSSSSSPPFLIPKHKQLFKFSSPSSPSSSFKALAQSEGTERVVKEQDPPASFSGSSSSARAQLDLLEQLTSTGSYSADGYESEGSSSKLTIRDQLAQLVADRDGNFSLPLGRNLKKVSAKFLTISQKRNIRRQAYLNEVSQRNDSAFFTTVGAFVILPPLVILGIAILTGYVQLFP